MRCRRTYKRNQEGHDTPIMISDNFKNEILTNSVSLPSNSLSTSAMVGLIVGLVIFCLAITALLLFYSARNRRIEEKQRQDLDNDAALFSHLLQVKAEPPKHPPPVYVSDVSPPRYTVWCIYEFYDDEAALTFRQLGIDTATLGYLCDTSLDLCMPSHHQPLQMLSPLSWTWDLQQQSAKIHIRLFLW